MNILVITELYPADETQSELDSTYFLHYFSKEWSTEHNVKVINCRRSYPKTLNLIPKFKEKNQYYNTYEFEKDGIKVFRYGVRAIPIPKITEVEYGINKIGRRIAAQLDNICFKPDIIICHMMYPSLRIALKLKHIYRVPLILSMHSWDEAVTLRKRRNLKLLEKNLSNIDAFGFRSKVLKEKINRLIEIPEQKSMIVYSGIEESSIIDKFNLNKKICSQPKIISTVARLEKRKHIDIVLKSFSKLENKNDLILNIIGDGAELGNLKHLAKSLRIENKVNFLGKLSRDTVMSLLQDTHIFVLASSRETLGLVYLEAMSQGCITIGSKEEGIDGIIINEFNGFLVHKEDIEELTETFQKILNMNLCKKENLILNTINTMSELTMKKVAIRYLDDINTIISQKFN